MSSDSTRLVECAVPIPTMEFRLLLVLMLFHVCKGRNSCPYITDAVSGARITNSRGEGEVESEFVCPAEWNWDHMREKVQFMLKNEEIKFIRFRAPVRGYSNPRLGLERWSGFVTWIWVPDQFDYMLYYPQNFQTLSLGTTDIIVSNMEDDDIRIDCSRCTTNASCGVGFYELRGLIRNVSDQLGVEWGYLCVEADCGVTDIVSDYPPEQSLRMLNTRNFALPDILYQARFIKLFYTKCSFLEDECKEVPNYYCYGLNGYCIVKEVMCHYNIIVYLSLVFWLFSPILVFYLPSSRRTYSLKHVSDMFPTYKSPVYFGRCIQDILCYHISVTDHHSEYLIRMRRFFALLALATLSFRFLLLPTYQLFSWAVFILFVIAAVLPHYISVYVNPQVPQCFPLFNTPYPAGIVKWHGSRVNSIEYQKLAYIMIERIYMATDSKFWAYIVENSFWYMTLFYHQPSAFPPLWICKMLLGVLAGVVTFSFSITIVLVYFVVPMPYFAKELFLSINSGVYKYCSTIRNSQTLGKAKKLLIILLSFFHAAILCILLLYFILSLFSACFLLTEIAIFTYLGASIAADKVLHYFLLIVAVGTAVYTMIHAIHKLYSSILKDAVFLLESDAEFDYIESQLLKRPNLALTLEKTDHKGVYLKGIAPSQFREQLYINEEFVSYMNSEMYFSIVESLQPIRRQVLLLFVKLLIMIFFIGLSMWVKNVYKSESKVSDIFEMAGNVAVYFIPTVLQFLSSQSQFGRKMDAQQRVDIATKIVDYIHEKSKAI